MISGETVWSISRLARAIIASIVMTLVVSARPRCG